MMEDGLHCGSMNTNEGRAGTTELHNTQFHPTKLPTSQTLTLAAVIWLSAGDIDDFTSHSDTPLTQTDTTIIG